MPVDEIERVIVYEATELIGNDDDPEALEER
jgi:hypothetical protein